MICYLKRDIARNKVKNDYLGEQNLDAIGYPEGSNLLQASSPVPLHLLTFLYEGIACGKMFENVLIIHVIDLYDEVLETVEQVVVQWEPEDGDYMRDIGLFDGLFPPQGE
ncbi:hypothetical protein ACLMJK_007135 [Lecanora helva]